MRKRKFTRKCFRCEIKKDRKQFSEKTSLTSSSICLDCFKWIKKFGPKTWHEECKLIEDDPNYDPLGMGDDKYVKKWNLKNPVNIRPLTVTEKLALLTAK